MCFNLQIGISNIPHKQRKGEQGARGLTSYSVMIGDTVQLEKRVNDKTGTHAVTLTKHTKLWKGVAYFLEHEESGSEDERPAKREKPSITQVRDRLRGNKGESVVSSGNKDKNAQQREEYQKDLMNRKRDEIEKKKSQSIVDRAFNKGKDLAGSGEILAYDKVSDYPRDINKLQIGVDVAREVVFLPINNLPVPFHISTIKNVSKSEGDIATFLRINFYTPAQAWGRDAPPAIIKHAGENPKATYVKELTFRAKNAQNLNKQLRLIKELQKRTRARLREFNEMKDVVEQVPLKAIRQPPRLQDLSMRPTLSGRKTQGTLEAHENGFRFRSIKNEKVRPD